MTFSSDTIQQAMRSSGMIPVFFNADIEVAKAVLDAAYKGGVRVFEFTNRGENAFQVFTQLIKHAAQYPDLMLGIGTIMNAEATLKYIGAGAHFIVSPILKAEMATACQKENILWIPGCATLTEIVTAKDLGAKVIKIFPGSVLGPGFVSSIMPVVPGLQLMPTGGVEPTEANLSAWFKAGVICVGMGSQLFTKEIIERKDWARLQQNVSDALAIIKTIRK
ncbi:MAG: bifunctional 4-hydroxy-2-oxoglutarate aldolase/2-dehydro-3-deoxy-phosphogluconate aldolase [Cyclobacteriaceae bacterium]|jgi:2-dehydro-3-deoxyphosphogluconate aldolase/(4S)-4-hydroxy-2-oxoglutarate aldolase|nr:bifunctional 4-hydroxy-2-oxoglutarate aldolase/2-dehydro-3-deoxy-phosphogluconate aldolase [Cyclobacteriaceae bacterium]MDH4297382.1 bifunctional 4-hydroxy-2-oxoglutarate aldolase/2-dehydro-3-deoxy-phosphogluconate aldolase [Cyclobacteriaceae bacterium]MDH5251153.1 bifunctional 4-hydroxy-2-oxoglutarate aldolase/2-dehydro-3-deoxy-phosphogluconate aldolase [Cyclobacteriaceae bacterium]